jgi:hypothetical protein
MKIKSRYLSLLFIVLIAFACKSLKSQGNSLQVSVKNNTNNNKVAETVEINWEKLSMFKNVKQEKIIVKSASTGVEIPSQIIYHGQKSPKAIIFQASLKANSEQIYIITEGNKTDYEPKVYGRKVPERFDDFAWENDKVAFRMYGEALESQKGMAKGIDFWAKRTENMVINKWYKSGNYHKDNGEGVDAYHVGITLGAGNAEPFFNDNIIYPINYSEYRILDQGPIRITFQLIYKPFMVNGVEVNEVKTISLDAGSQVNKITNSYQSAKDLDIAIGITKHKNDGEKYVNKENNILAYWDNADGDKVNGMMGVGVFYTQNKVKVFKETTEHLLMIVPLGATKEITYYQGGGWSKSGNFNSSKDWFDKLVNISYQLNNPLVVEVK